MSKWDEISLPIPCVYKYPVFINTSYIILSECTVLFYKYYYFPINRNQAVWLGVSLMPILSRLPPNHHYHKLPDPLFILPRKPSPTQSTIHYLIKVMINSQPTRNTAGTIQCCFNVGQASQNIGSISYFSSSIISAIDRFLTITAASCCIHSPCRWLNVG